MRRLLGRLLALDRSVPPGNGSDAYYLIAVINTPDGPYYADRLQALIIPRSPHDRGPPPERFRPFRPGVDDVPPRGFRLRRFEFDVDDVADLDDGMVVYYGPPEFDERYHWTGFYDGERRGDLDRLRNRPPRIEFSNKYRYNPSLREVPP